MELKKKLTTKYFYRSFNKKPWFVSLGIWLIKGYVNADMYICKDCQYPLYIANKSKDNITYHKFVCKHCGRVSYDKTLNMEAEEWESL